MAAMIGGQSIGWVAGREGGSSGEGEAGTVLGRSVGSNPDSARQQSCARRVEFTLESSIDSLIEPIDWP